MKNMTMKQYADVVERMGDRVTVVARIVINSDGALADSIGMGKHMLEDMAKSVSKSIVNAYDYDEEVFNRLVQDSVNYARRVLDEEFERVSIRSIGLTLYVKEGLTDYALERFITKYINEQHELEQERLKEEGKEVEEAGVSINLVIRRTTK